MAEVDPITELQRCMALVRPVGLSDSAVRDWIAAAAAEVRDFAVYRPERFKAACDSARKSCTHHGQIVPTILKSQFHEWEIADGSHRKGLAAICGPRTTAPQIGHRGGGAKQIGQVKALQHIEVEGD